MRLTDGSVAYFAACAGLALGVICEWAVAKWRDRRNPNEEEA